MAKINMDFCKLKHQDIKSSDIDRVIRGYIMAVGEENCDKAIEYDPRIEVFMQLSSARASTISWYPFKEGASILEIEGGFGALTGELCNKARRVVVTEPSFFRAKAIENRYKNRENLEICIGDADDMIFAEPFDYIVLCGVLENKGEGTYNDTYMQYLRLILKHLRQEGKVLVAANNLYSINRWESLKVMPIYNQLAKEKVQYFHRKQLQDIMAGVGLIYQKYYYPMPDYRVVGCVYSDDSLPNAEEWQQLKDYSIEKSIMNKEERVVLRNILDNGNFAFFANSFFIEAGRTAELSRVKKIRVLSDIGKNNWNSITQIEKKAKDKSALIMEALRFRPVLMEIDQDKQELERVVHVQMELLRYLKQVCDKYDLKFFMIYGTLLGAVRHGGMIPGDDDIDVAMYREDYDKLLTLTSEFYGDYFLQTPWNDNCFYGGYLKLRNRNTTAIQPQNWWIDCCEGIGIDIFPLDNGYHNTFREKFKIARICFYQRLLYAKSYGFFAKFLDMPLLKWKAYKYWSKLYNREQLANKLNRVLAEGESNKNSPFGIYAHYIKGRGYRKLSRELFEETIDLAFGDMLLGAPKGRYEILEMIYGENYMIQPEWHEGKKRHGFYRSDTPYNVYKNRFAGLMKPAPLDKEIVLFGDGLLFDAYFRRYKSSFVPEHIVLVNEEKTMTEVCGICVEQFENFHPKNKEKLYSVICSIDIKAAEIALQQAGYRDYYIFVENREWLLLANPLYALQELKGN